MNCGVGEDSFPDEVLADNYAREEAFGRTPAIVCLQPHETLGQNCWAELGQAQNHNNGEEEEEEEEEVLSH